MIRTPASLLPTLGMGDLAKRLDIARQRLAFGYLTVTDRRVIMEQVELLSSEMTRRGAGAAS